MSGDGSYDFIKNNYFCSTIIFVHAIRFLQIRTLICYVIYGLVGNEGLAEHFIVQWRYIIIIQMHKLKRISGVHFYHSFHL